ncbi:flagellar export protein FliJ [Alcaligenes endophyticus]|uniref:Flagellar FliJ protein n=1 Tax=Alcaligenes endophyticus TaxID=1929088 RepID=A0ABT8ELH7_9BURK|nr:flagellar export protein FliJ [Alcaligenes endophyticus]MCX5590571.1 flagellar export protein FliJ [Alcaligenes endophyticus]MDN4122065.1 flagella biosynthesis chaperone FliJ [Alcaligenes endophyticus]
MKPSNSLDLLVDLGQNHLEQAGQQLHSISSQQRAAAEQLEMLQGYRQDYAQRLLEAGRTGLTMSNYHNFVRFIATLDEAIQQQNKILQKLDDKVSASRDNWNEKRVRVNAYETLVERRQYRALKEQARQEQIQTDEISARLYAKAQGTY